MPSEDFMISDNQGGRRTKAAQEQSALEYALDLKEAERLKYVKAAEAFNDKYQTIKSFGSAFFILRNSAQEGVYDKLSDKTLNSELSHFLETDTTLPVCKKSIEEVIFAISNKYDVIVSSSDYLPFNNGKFNKETKQLEPYSHKDFYVDAFNYDFDSSAKDWSAIDKFLNELTCNDPQFKSTLIAFCYKVIFQKKNWEYFLYLYGEGATGKTTFILFLESLATTYSETTLKQLNSSFGLENVWAKVLVVSPDESKCCDDMSVLKTLTSQANTVSVNRKGRPIEDLPFTGSVVMASNEPVFIGNFDGGVERRALIVPCLNEIKAKDRDYFLKEKLKAQVPAFVQYLLSLDEAEQRQALNSHCELPSVIALTQSFKDEADSIQAFASERLMLKESNLIETKTMYQLYVVYCQESGRKPKNLIHFGRGLLHIFRLNPVARVQKSRVWYYEGLSLS